MSQRVRLPFIAIPFRSSSISLRVSLPCRPKVKSAASTRQARHFLKALTCGTRLSTKVISRPGYWLCFLVKRESPRLRLRNSKDLLAALRIVRNNTGHQTAARLSKQCHLPRIMWGSFCAWLPVLEIHIGAERRPGQIIYALKLAACWHCASMLAFASSTRIDS